MTDVALTFDRAAIQAAVAKLTRLGDGLIGEALELVGAVAESGARRRFEEKAGPDGAPWAPWSERHAATRRSAMSLLVEQGDLRDSLAHEVRGKSVAVGAATVYAAIQQVGGAGVGRPGHPARPFLGMSDGDWADVTALIEDFVARSLGP